jgi:hypothetical protein
MGFFSGLADHLTPHHVVIMHGAGETAIRDALTNISMPGAVVEWLAEEASPPESSPAYGKCAIEGRATAYVCVGPQCSPPVTGADELLSALRLSRHEQLT